MATPVKTVPVQPSRELAHVRYFIDGSVNAGVKNKLVELLQAYGACPAKTVAVADNDTATLTTEIGNNVNASQEQPPKKEKVDLQDLTHVITMSMHFQDYEEINARNTAVTKAAEAAGKQIGTAPGATGRRGDLIAVVTPLWVTKTCDYKKRQEEAYFSPDPKKIFSGVTVCTDGLPPGDSEAVKGIVSALGGQWRAPLVAEVTHLVCLNLEGKKAQRLMGTGLRLGMKAVLPHWIDDCIKLNLRVPEDPYLFPKPPCFDTVVRAPIPYEQRLAEHYTKLGKQMPPVSNYSSSVLEPHVLEGESQASIGSADDRTVTVTASNVPPSGAFAGKSVYVAQSCDLSPEKLQMFLLKIREAGGEPLAGANIKENIVLLEKADIAVVNFRDGWEYWKAYEANKIIGNIEWLIYILFTSGITESSLMPLPTDRTLHYPWPRKPLPEFKDTNFTVSGYVGPSRETIKRMIELLGGTFEGTLTKGKTTHLIASVQSGSKVMHARPWKIPILNHHWIEECFAQWKLLGFEDERYTSFDSNAIDRDLPAFVNGRPIVASYVEAWARTPEVLEERDDAIKNVDNAIIDEMDEAQQDDLLLSSPAMSAEDTPPPQQSQNVDAADTTIQQITTMLQQRDGMEVDEPASPLPASVIAQSQYPPSPSASENASVAAAIAHNLKKRDEKRAAGYREWIVPVQTSTPPVQGAETKAPTIPEPPSSVSTSDAQSDTSVNEKKRKRSSLAGLGEVGGLAQSTNGYMGRKAAQAATQKLHDTIMPDLLRYEKEKQGGGKKQLEEMFGGRGPSSSAKKPSHATSKLPGRQSARAGSASSGGSEAEPFADGTSPAPVTARRGRQAGQAEPEPPTPHVAASKVSKGKAPAKAATKSAKVEAEYASAVPPSRKQNGVSKVVQAGRKVHIASTGVPLDEKARKALVKMGAKVLGDNIDGCTHIVVSKISRTVKFLTAIPLGAYFVTEGWVTGSVENGMFIDEEGFLLKDKEGEKKHAMNLARSVMRARRSKIFDDYTFYITPQVQPSFEALKAISEAAGAKVIKRLPTVKQVSDRADVFVVSSEAERSSWEHLVSQGVPVYSGEAIIKAIMQQEKEFDLYMLESEDS